VGPLWSQGLKTISVNYGVLGKIGIKGRESEGKVLFGKFAEGYG
jgi:hypothetical protein